MIHSRRSNSARERNCGRNHSSQDLSQNQASITSTPEPSQAPPDASSGKLAGGVIQENNHVATSVEQALGELASALILASSSEKAAQLSQLVQRSPVSEPEAATRIDTVNISADTGAYFAETCLSQEAPTGPRELEPREPPERDTAQPLAGPTPRSPTIVCLDGENGMYDYGDDDRFSKTGVETDADFMNLDGDIDLTHCYRPFF